MHKINLNSKMDYSIITECSAIANRKHIHTCKWFSSDPHNSDILMTVQMSFTDEGGCTVTETSE